MKVQLLPIREQVVVITGASSGIGLVTAARIAQLGGRVVLAARNEQDLQGTVEEIRNAGGHAIAVTADVAEPEQVERIANEAIREFGAITTWVNNAAVGLYGRVMELPIDDLRRQMDVNYWGHVYGSITAVRHMRRTGGALINVGSVLSDRAVPLQVNYCAAKHAVKAFTDGLRMELEEQGIPISVTLVKPASIDTPFYDKARSYMGTEPQPVPPVYAPEVVANVIVQAAQRPMREVIAGGAGIGVSAARFAPRTADLALERWGFEAQTTGEQVLSRQDNLYAPVAQDGGPRGRNWRGRTLERSVLTSAMLHPVATAALVGVCAVAAGVALSRTGNGHQEEVQGARW